MMKLHGVLPWTKNKTKNKIPFSLLHSMSHHYQHSKLNSPFSYQHSQNGCQARLDFRWLLWARSQTTFIATFMQPKEFPSHSIPCPLTSYTPQLETLQGTALILVCSHVASHLGERIMKKILLHLNEKKKKSLDPSGGNAFVLVHQHGYCDVSWKSAK